MIKAVIVDDELHAINVLTKLLEKLDIVIEIVASATSVNDGYEVIQQYQPDLVFLDVEMPGGNGFDLLSKFTAVTFQVIFTTAYEHYALQAIKISALDYILKPIAIEELNAAVKKVSTKKVQEAKRVVSLLENLHTNQLKSIVLPNKGSYEPINISEIILLKADNNYTEFILQNGKTILVSKTIKEYEDLLINKGFFRVHKSTIINLTHIEKYTKGDGGEVLMNNGSIAKVSRYRKKEFLKMFYD